VFSTHTDPEIIPAFSVF